MNISIAGFHHYGPARNASNYPGSVRIATAHELSRGHTATLRTRVIALSFLTHATILFLVVALVTGRSLPPLLTGEASVAIVFEPAPAIAPLSPELAPPAPTESTPPTHLETPAEVSTPPTEAVPLPPPLVIAPDTISVPEAPAPALHAPAPSHPSVARPARPFTKTAPAPAETSPTVAKQELAAAAPIVPPRAVAGMANNRSPTYPEISRRRGEEGNVLLRVSVSAGGMPLAVDVLQTSGHASLDSAAQTAVRQWLFIPATQAGTPVPAIAEIPIRFRLGD